MRSIHLSHTKQLYGRAFALVILLAAAAPTFAQTGSTPFDTGFTSIETLFTGTIAKVASLVAIVIGGYGFAHGEPGAKKLCHSVFIPIL